jgi:hypothetical protein
MSENKFSLKDLSALSEPACKLIDAVSQCIGTLYEPTRIRRKAKAEADATLILAGADAKRQALLKRAAHRLAIQEVHRQKNIESIISHAVKSLPETVSRDPVEPDWVSRFFDECKDVSNEELQNLWGRLLAGEVSSPGSCSRKTLTILKDLSPLDAQLFIKVCGLIFSSYKNYFIPFDFTENRFFEKYGINHDDLLHLATLDLLHIEHSRAMFTNMQELKYFDLNLICYTTSDWEIDYYAITQYGIELLSIANIEPNWPFFDYWVKTFSEFYQIYLACLFPKEFAC